MKILKNPKLWLVVGTLVTAIGGAWASGASFEAILDIVLNALGGAK